MNLLDESSKQVLETFADSIRYSDRPLLAETRKALNQMSANMHLFNLCQYSNDTYGSELIRLCSNKQLLDEEGIGELSYYVYNFYIELELISNSSMLIREQIQRFEDLKAEVYFPNFSSIKQNLPYKLFRFYFNQPIQNETRTLPECIDKASEEKQKLEAMLQEKQMAASALEEKIDTHRQILEGLKTDYNFVGLSHGFSGLLTNKQTDLEKNSRLLTFLAVLLFIPVLLALLAYFLTEDNMTLEQHIFLFMPVFSAEILLLYFYRIALFNHKSLKTQIVQLELRQTLCQFIQSYADYSKELQDKNEHTLERFESVIFSNILLDSSNIPATFDGIEQITQLINSIKK